MWPNGPPRVEQGEDEEMVGALRWRSHLEGLLLLLLHVICADGYIHTQLLWNTMGCSYDPNKTGASGKTFSVNVLFLLSSLLYPSYNNESCACVYVCAVK